MAKPDYTRWDKVTAFSLREAAFLLCDKEPFEPTENHPVPPEVQAMMRQLNQGLAPDRDTGEREFYESFRHRQPAERHVPGEQYYLRETLEKWTADGKLWAPFLVPEQREPGCGNNWPFSYDTRLLKVIREVIREHWERTAPKDAPSRDAVVKWLVARGLSRREAEAVDLVTRHESRRKPNSKA